MFDVVIIGAGAAGLSVVMELPPSISCAVVEPLSASFTNKTMYPGNIDVCSFEHRGAIDAHGHGLGGTTQLWGGQLWPWRVSDFRTQTAQWPIQPEEIQRSYYGTLLNIIGQKLANTHHTIHNRPEAVGLAQEVCGISLRHSTWLNRRLRNFGRNPYIRQGMRNVPIVDAEVLSIQNQSSAWVDVRLKDSDGSQRFISGKTVILAAGTISNIAILLASDLHPVSPTLGRYFMDHVSSRYAKANISDWSAFRRCFAPRYIHGTRTTPRLMSTPALGAYGHWEVELADDSPLRLTKRLLSAQSEGNAGHSQPAPGIAHRHASIADITGLAYDVVRRQQQPIPASASVYLRVDVEQRPNAPHAVTMEESARREGGTLDVDWESTTEDMATFVAAGEDLSGRIQLGSASGIASLEPLNQHNLTDTYHLMGGTRMGLSAADGVVSEHLEVHGMPQVYVAGASTFRSGGLANPTYTSMALSHRLAHHIMSL